MSEVTAEDIAWMRGALALAAEADLPFGAVIVKDGKMLARGRNSGQRFKDPTAHGEIVAIRECLAAHGSEMLRGATIYTSGEPCPMCMGAILWCRIARVVYAASIAPTATFTPLAIASSRGPARRSRPLRKSANTWAR